MALFPPPSVPVAALAVSPCGSPLSLDILDMAFYFLENEIIDAADNSSSLLMIETISVVMLPVNLLLSSGNQSFVLTRTFHHTEQTNAQIKVFYFSGKYIKVAFEQHI